MLRKDVVSWPQTSGPPLYLEKLGADCYIDLALEEMPRPLADPPKVLYGGRQFVTTPCRRGSG